MFGKGFELVFWEAVLVSSIGLVVNHSNASSVPWGRGGGVMPYMGYIGMCRCEGYGFQAAYSGIEYINQRVWV